MLVMGHAGGLESRFMHLQSRYVVRAGQAVKKGQLIGYMGNTGNSTGAHLHWEIYRGNTPINPRSLV
jgi:murein DD-endopeptidase MepM/ murein hydrolase activator NlpD